jgi:hypothetical protein
MREIDIKAGLDRYTVLGYGPLRAGKSRFAATFPRPLFLSDGVESGWTTIQAMLKQSPQLFFEPERNPPIRNPWVIERAADLEQALPRIEPLVRSGEVQTVVIDSITYLADLKLVELKGRKGNWDPRQHYGDLGDWLAYVRTMYHQLPVNIVWTALVQPPGEDTPMGGPLIPGKSSLKFGGACDVVLYFRTVSPPGQPTQYECRTRAFGSYPAGGRDEGQLTDPLGYFVEGAKEGEYKHVPDATYRTLAEAVSLGLPKVAKDYRLPMSVAPAPQVVQERAQKR